MRTRADAAARRWSHEIVPSRSDPHLASIRDVTYDLRVWRSGNDSHPTTPWSVLGTGINVVQRAEAPDFGYFRFRTPAR